jgi:hypothetical protein
MFKKNTAVPGFVIGPFIKTSDGSEITTGTPTCKRIIDDTPAACDNAASYDSTFGAWKIDLTAADLNGNTIGLKFSLTDCQPRSFVIKTVSGIPDATGYFPSDVKVIKTADADTWLTATAGADAHLDKPNGVETGFTLRQVLRLMAAILLGKVYGGQTGTETFVSITGETDRVRFTDDGSGNRTATTYTVT